MASSASSHTRPANQVAEIGWRGHCLEGRHARPPGVATRQEPEPRQQAARGQAKHLTAHFDPVALREAGAQHHPVAPGVWTGPGLAEDMRPFEMPHRGVVMALGEGAAGKPRLGLEGGAPLGRRHHRFSAM